MTQHTSILGNEKEHFLSNFFYFFSSVFFFFKLSKTPVYLTKHVFVFFNILRRIFIFSLFIYLFIFWFVSEL